MKKLLILMSICASVFFLGCSLKQSEASIPKSVIDEKEAITTDTGTKTLATKAMEKFYSEKSEYDPIIVYEEIPFEDGTLVLEEAIEDGERYPNLHFIDKNWNVTYLTQESSCWTQNYTQFKGYNIFFGRVGKIAKQGGNDLISVKKVEAIFSDKIESVTPKEKIISCINPKKKDIDISGNSRGYILPIKSKEMPDDLVAIFENGEKVSLCQKAIRNEEDMPDYLKVKNARIYNSFAFTFCSMLTPVEWKQEGQIYLKGKTYENGAVNELYLRPLGHMSQIDSFILPQDIKSLYLSNNCRWLSCLSTFSADEIVEVSYPHERKLLDCRILKLTKDMVDKEIGQDDLSLINANAKNQIKLPNEKGYYLLGVRTEKEEEIQAYTIVFQIGEEEQK